jgi:hypothetical protein
VISPDEGVEKTDEHVLPDSFLETAIGSKRAEQNIAETMTSEESER